MKGAGRRLSARLGRVAKRMVAVRKGLNRGKSLSYAAMSGGCAIVAYGVIDTSLSLALVGASFLATGVFARSMMGATKDISERLFDGQERILEGQDRILEAIQGPPQFDKDGKPVVKGNLMDKLDELIDAINRMSSSINRMSSSIDRMSNNRP